MTIDLEKKLDLRKQIVFDLSKEKGIEKEKARIVLCLDYSYSMDHLYRSGYVQEVLERIVPVAMQFDDNQEMELYLFQNNALKVSKNVTVKNIVDFIGREVNNKYPMGGTSYAPAIDLIMRDCAPQSTGGFFGFGKKSSQLEHPVYVIFITDGDSADHSDSEKAIKNASKQGVFFQFIGIGKENFPFLQKLDTMVGRELDNANFFSINDLNALTDRDLYGKLLNEFPGWIPQARKAGMIK